MNLPSRFTVLGVVGKGGFGEVTRCHDTVLSRDVVIKKVLNPDHLPKLIDEVVALQGAKSKHVVEMYDLVVDATSSEFAIVEEWLPGEELSAFVFNPSDLMSFYRVIYQICVGISDIHARNVVHRDLKPNNMKYDAEGYLRIFDFGISKVGPLPAGTMSVTGTPGYMAPELFQYPVLIDKPIDIYAFGALVFQLVTKFPPPCAKPFPIAPTALLVSDSISTKGLPQNKATELIDKCLDLTPATRPTAIELRDAIESILLFGKHKAVLTNGASRVELSTVGKGIRAKHLSNEVEISYDGYAFTVTSVTGYVFVNNEPTVVGTRLKGAHVLTLGQTGIRRFVTFDVSHPEVKL